MIFLNIKKVLQTGLAHTSSISKSNHDFQILFINIRLIFQFHRNIDLFIYGVSSVAFTSFLVTCNIWCENTSTDVDSGFDLSNYRYSSFHARVTIGMIKWILGRAV